MFDCLSCSAPSVVSKGGKIEKSLSGGTCSNRRDKKIKKSNKFCFDFSATFEKSAKFKCSCAEVNKVVRQ